MKKMFQILNLTLASILAISIFPAMLPNAAASGVYMTAPIGGGPNAPTDTLPVLKMPADKPSSPDTSESIVSKTEPKEVKITFFANAKAKQSIKLHAGDKFGKLPIYSAVGYKFNGWYTENGVKVTKNSRVPSENTTYYAKWIKNAQIAKDVKVTFNAGKQAKTSRKYNKGEKLGKLPAFNMYGYKFNGWYTEKGANGKKVSKNTKVLGENTTYYAKWTKK